MISTWFLIPIALVVIAAAGVGYLCGDKQTQYVSRKIYLQRPKCSTWGAETRLKTYIEEVGRGILHDAATEKEMKKLRKAFEVEMLRALGPTGEQFINWTSSTLVVTRY